MISDKIKSNYLYNVSYQLLLLLTPILVTPYLSHIFGVEIIGKISYIQSIVYYFVLFSIFGINIYGQREMAYAQGNREQMSSIFNQLLVLKFILIVISSFIYTMFFCLHGDDKVLYSIQLIEIIAVLFDITWFYQGLQEFKKILIRGICIKAMSVSLIFILIKSKNDVFKYLLIYSASIFIGNIVLWLNLSKKIDLFKIKSIKLYFHFRNCLILFVPSLAIQLYTVLDKTMIGILTKDYAQNGYYEQSQKIIRMTVTIITALSTVMLTQMSTAFFEKQHTKLKIYLQDSISFIIFSAFPLCLGIIAISPNLVPWFLGHEFIAATTLLQILATIIPMIGLSTLINSYLISINKNKIFTFIVMLGCIVNIVLNLIFIPKFGAKGACVASVIAEFVILVMDFIYVFPIINKSNFLKNVVKYLGLSLIMFLLIKYVSKYLDINTFSTFIEIAVGIIVYILLLFITKDQILFSILKINTTKDRWLS